jgi:hypothetical protein
VSVEISWGERLRRELLPTGPQALAAAAIALFFLVASQFKPLLEKVGITDTAIDITKQAVGTRLEVVLKSGIAQQAALLTFWATVGLVAYLICWAAYNMLIEARNEVTLNTAYTNRGHWRGPFMVLALKAASAVGLAIVLWSLRYGVSFWLALMAGSLITPAPGSLIQAVLAVFGLALQLYIVFVFIQLTFTPWYRALPFTDN